MKITVKANRQLPQKRSKNVYASRNQAILRDRATSRRPIKASYDKNRYQRIARKSVPDVDGFTTDYTMYYDTETGLYIFILGDNDVYNPDNAEPDFECETNEEATEWWNSYGETDIYSNSQIHKNRRNVIASNRRNNIRKRTSKISAARSTRNKFYVKAHRSLVDWLETIADEIYDLPEISNFKWDKGHSRCIFTSDNAPGVEFYLYREGNDFIWDASSSEYSRIHFEDFNDISEFIDNIQWEIKDPIGISGSTAIKAYDEAGLDSLWEEISSIGQEFTSENTSINSSKLPAIFNLVKFESGTINLDYGGGRFDNVAEYLAKADVVNLVLDPYNRTAEHNKEVIDLIKKAGGADTATCSNVLNVIKEPEVRQYVMGNIKKLVKDGGKVYFTVYEGNGSGEGKETKSGYQLNRKTKDYIEEIQKIFPDAKRKGKLIIATNGGTAVNSASRITASSNFDIADLFNIASDTIDPDTGSVDSIASANNTLQFEHFRIYEYDVGSYIVFIDASGLIQVCDGESGTTYASFGSSAGFRRYCQQINNGHRQMIDEYEGNYSANASTRIGAAVSYGFEPHDVEPEELDATTEEIEIPFDCNVILDEYTWEYEDPKCDWAAGPGSNGSWYSDNGTLIGDQDSIVECVNDLLSDLLPPGTGNYHISGTAILVFDVSGGVKYSRYSGKDEDSDPIIDEDIDLTDSEADFDLRSSSIKDFKYEELN